MSETSSSPRVYFAVFAALLLLTGLTAAVAYVNLGDFNVVAALTIAVVKALLVATFFMHLRGGSRLLWLYAGAGVLWLMLLMALTLNDAFTRAWF
jgi:cytochrome c oxidase subunit 4